MPIPVTHHSGRSTADSALARALRMDGAARREELGVLSQRYPEHGPTWLALAEEHSRKGRLEEARYAAKRALRTDGSLARHFSHELARECASMMPPRRPGSSARAADLDADAQRVQKMRERIREHGDADIELGQAKRLFGLMRSERLEEATRRFPEHGPTWLALAEDYLAQRRIDKAMSAYQRALSLDPEQARFASPKLETAHRYYDAEAPARPEPPPPSRPEPSYGRESLRRLQSRAGSSIDVPRSNPNERTKYIPFSKIQGRPRAKSVPSYLRAPSPAHDLDFSPPPRSYGAHPPRDVGQELERALDHSTAAARVQALRRLEQHAPTHPGVLYHLAMQSVMAGNLDEARGAGHALYRVDPRRYRQLYDWADEWAKNAQHERPAHEPRLERPRHQVAASARTLCLELPRPVERQPSAPMVPTGCQPHKTQLLPVPAGFLQTSAAPRATSPSAPFHIEAPRQQPRSLVGSRLRTAGALIAGVAAGLLVAMLLVFVVNSTGSLESRNERMDDRPAVTSEGRDPVIEAILASGAGDEDAARMRSETAASSRRGR